MPRSGVSYLGIADMDLSTALILGWIVFCFILLVVLAFVRKYYLKPRNVPSKGPTASEGSQASGAAAATSTATTGKRLGLSTKSSAPSSPVHQFKSESLGLGSPISERSLVSVTASTGTDKEGLRWVDDALRWVLQDVKVACNICQVWLNTLNNLTKSAAAEHGVHVVFEKLVTSASLPPTLRNVTVDVNASDEFTISCDIESEKLEFTVNATRQKGDRVWTSTYRLVVGFKGTLRIFCVPSDKYATVRLSEPPILQISISHESETQPNHSLDEQALQRVLEEIIEKALTVWQMDLDFSQQTNFPPFVRAYASPLPPKPIHYDSMVTAVPIPVRKPPTKCDKRLLVKVIKASSLARGCAEPYCVVEMDEPVQKYRTSCAADTNNPFWDEHFLFDLGQSSTEILFELYDRTRQQKDDGFLGLGILSIDELLQKPNQRQIIVLQSRPYEDDDVSGTLTVEFLFMESVDIPLLNETSSANLERRSPNLTKTETNRVVTSGGTVITTTKTTISKPVVGTALPSDGVASPTNNYHRPTDPGLMEHSIHSSNSHLHDPESHVENTPLSSEICMDTLALTGNDSMLNGGDDIAHTVLRDLESRPVGNTSTNKSTLIIHSVQREVVNPNVKVERTKNGKWHEVVQPEPGRLDGSDSSSTKDLESDLHTSKAESVISSSSSKGFSDERSRPKARRSFMKNLRKRFSFRDRRSKSTEQPADYTVDGSASRSASMDRAQSVPGSSQLEVPVGGRVETGSTRSSLSEASALSTSSTQTYLNDASTLIVEVLENGIKRHYLLPISMATNRKWRKKGTKLHVFNDHTFVAKHVPGNSICQVCSKAVPRSIGKQAYQCRDCSLCCHKQCHTKTDHPCSNSSVNMMELECVGDVQPQSPSTRSKRVKS